MHTHTFLFNNTCEDPSGPIFEIITQTIWSVDGSKWAAMKGILYFMNELSRHHVKWHWLASFWADVLKEARTSLSESSCLSAKSSLTQCCRSNKPPVSNFSVSILWILVTTDFDSCPHPTPRQKKTAAQTPLESVLLLSGWILLVFHEAKSTRRLECVILIFRRLDPDVRVPHRINHTKSDVSFSASVRSKILYNTWRVYEQIPQLHFMFSANYHAIITVCALYGFSLNPLKVNTRPPTAPISQLFFVV